MFATARRVAWARATSSIDGERSTAVTDPARCANGMARRPTPHPYSRIEAGAKSGTNRAAMVRNVDSTNASPVSKNSRSCAAVRFARRNLGDVKTVKYGSRRAEASHCASGVATRPPGRTGMDIDYGRQPVGWIGGRQKPGSEGGRRGVRGVSDTPPTPPKRRRIKRDRQRMTKRTPVIAASAALLLILAAL